MRATDIFAKNTRKIIY